jgi:hypothetical protein
MDLNLFYPWFYKGEFTTCLANTILNPTSSNNKKKELQRLTNDLTIIKPNNTQVYINIGSSSNSQQNKLRQLPMFLTEKNILIILIDTFTTLPEIITDLECLKISHNTYSKNNITIKLYNTYLPTFLNSHKVRFIDNNFNNTIRLKQDSSDDEKFVEHFYSCLNTFITNVDKGNGYTIIVNTATFSEINATGNIANLNFEMFPELLNVFGKVLLLVWPFNTFYFFIVGTMDKIHYRCDYDVKQFKNTTKILLGLQYYRESKINNLKD